MNKVATFAGIFKGAFDWKEFEALGNKPSPEIGRKALKAIQSDATMALEGVDGVSAMSNDARLDEAVKGLRRFVMAVESAQTDLGRLKGISYSMALQHSAVIGIDATPDNFNYQVSKKNYDIVTENLKTFALIGLSAIVVASLGYLVFKLLNSDKKKSKSAVEIVKLKKDVDKAVDTFASIDLSELPDEAKQKFIAITRGVIHPMVQGQVTESTILKDGLAVYVASSAYVASVSQVEAYRFAATAEDWLVESYLHAAEAMEKVVGDFIGVIEKLKTKPEVAMIDLKVLNNRTIDADQLLKKELGEWARYNGIPVDQAGEAWVEDIVGGLRVQTRLLPAELITRIGKEINVPKPDHYASFNKVTEALTSLGKKLDRAIKDLPKDALDANEADGFQIATTNLKGLVRDLDQLADMVRIEVEALATVYSYYSAGAKGYSQSIFEVLKEVNDEALVKKIKDQVAKGANALPKRRIVLESLKDDEGVMALESIDSDTGGGFKAGSSGIDILVDDLAEEYLALPDYSQAGYRFDPRDGYDGANLMATEAWSTGAKLAVGIAAGVGILGIGAMIASTLIKRSSTSRESHATADHIKTAGAQWKRLETEADNLADDLSGTQTAMYMNKEYLAINPQLEARFEVLKKRVQEANKMQIEVNGKSTPIGRAILEDMGEMAPIMASKLVEFSKSHPPRTVLEHDNERFAKTLHKLYDGLITSPLSALEAGRPPQDVLQTLNDFLDKDGRRSFEFLQDGGWGDIEVVLTQVDGNWLPLGMENSHSHEMITRPLEFFSAAEEVHNLLLDLNDKIAIDLEKYTISQRLLDRFERASANSGERDATASILRRIEEFKRPFSIFVRALRRDQENLEKYLGFIDRYIKAVGKNGKVLVDELKSIRAALASIRKEVEPQ